MSNTGWSAGTETEADLPFAGLHRLLRPVLSGADELPRRQREAILAAFGLSDGSASDLFLVGLAALTLLADPAAQSPLLLLVEDAHWLDRPSLQVIAFIAHRIESDAILLLAVARDGTGADIASLGLEELRLGRLGDEDASALLALCAPDLTERAADGHSLPAALAAGLTVALACLAMLMRYHRAVWEAVDSIVPLRGEANS